MNPEPIPHQGMVSRGCFGFVEYLSCAKEVGLCLGLCDVREKVVYHGLELSRYVGMCLR